jgi:1,4-alpha-glucan branching enzyme
VDLFENRYARDLAQAFARIQKAGALELITSAATHGYLPLLRTQPSAVRAQVLVAADSHRRNFGAAARGIWLPECGYYPGLEAVLEKAGFHHFTLDTHGILNASLRPTYGTWAPLACPGGVVGFGRDAQSSKQVWSATEGYPGDYYYRDFYRDVGFDLDFEYIKPYILDRHARVHTGLKYYRITGKTEHKEPYEPNRARERAERHAEDFLAKRLRAIETQAPRMDRPPLMTAPYDAELFGHWWFEGPQWLDLLIRKIACQPQHLELVTPSDYLARHPALQTAIPSGSSWGNQGYNEFWLNEGNDWIYPHLNHAAKRMRAATEELRSEPAGSLAHRCLQQAARSLLLAQASDWAFIIKTGTAVEYAYRRVRDHLARFDYLERSLRKGAIDVHRLQALEYMDNIFPDIDFRVFA